MDKKSKKEITDRIKLLRNKNVFTQEEMAEKVGLEYGSYVQMENGANLPSVGVLMKLSNIFDVSVDSILFGTVNKSRTDIDDVERLSSFLKLFDLEKLETAKKALEDLIVMTKAFESSDKSK